MLNKLGISNSAHSARSGMTYMFMSAFFFSLMGLMVRLVKEIPFMEVVIVRSAVSLLICLVLLLRARKSILGDQKGLLLLRGLFGFFGLSAYFYTIQQMPLAEAVAIQYTNPLFTALFAPIFLKERGSGREWQLSLLAFAGVFLIANPQSLSGYFPAAVGLFGAMCSGAAYNIVRKLGKNGEDPLRIVLYFPFVAILLGSPAAASQWIMPTTWQLLILLGVGLSTQIAQVALTKGLRAERAAKATLMNYLVIALSTFYSLILGETLSFFTFSGMALIIIAIALSNMKRDDKTA
jgi:drug/metabolite transporter (DMT)-like permease